MLRFLFNRGAKPDIPQTRLNAHDVSLILGCRAPEGGTKEETIGDPDGVFARYTFKDRVDGKTFELEIESRDEDGELYKSSVKGEYVSDRTLDIKEIIFDNEPETLRNAKEIYSVLNFIGHQVRDIAVFHDLPSLHENKGEFSAFGRFMTRIMPKPSGGGFF